MNTAAAQLARPRTQALRLTAWLAGPAAIAGVHFAMIDLHPIARMWALVFVLFFWMKSAVLVERDRAGKPLPKPFLPWLLLWPGMRPVARVASPERMGEATHATHATRGVAALAMGVVLVLTAQAIWMLTTNPWLTAPSALAACSLILHYGLFALLTAAWHAAGFNAGPLFRNPFAARSLADFWGRRWNLAYVEMCQETILRALKTASRESATVQRSSRQEARNSATANQPQIHTDEHGSAIGVNPCASVVPKRFALPRFRGEQLAVFLFSGLLHEVAISLPVNAGYGLPTLYFVINGGAMLLGRKLREGSVAARAWAAFWVIVPLPLVFHPWFVAGIVLPMIGINP